MEDELRTIRPHETEDITHFNDLNQGFFDRVKFLKSKPGSLREEVSELRQDVNDILDRRTTFAKEMDTRFFRVSNRLGKLETHLPNAKVPQKRVSLQRCHTHSQFDQVSGLYVGKKSVRTPTAPQKALTRSVHHPTVGVSRLPGPAPKAPSARKAVSLIHKPLRGDSTVVPDTQY